MNIVEKGVHGFDWDDANLKKCQKHGVHIAEVEFLFHNDPAVFPDSAHSSTETRYLAVGKDSTARHLFVTFTLRTRNSQVLIRPISVRYMHTKEINNYKKYENE